MCMVLKVSLKNTAAVQIVHFFKISHLQVFLGDKPIDSPRDYQMVVLVVVVVLYLPKSLKPDGATYHLPSGVSGVSWCSCRTV